MYTVNFIFGKRTGKSVDCGILVIVFLVDILFGYDPTAATYVNSVCMRQYLHDCLQKKYFPSPFPKYKVDSVHTLKFDPIINTVLIHCTCRMPYFEEDAHNTERPSYGSMR